MSATYGRKFKITVFGESHGEAIGVVLDGVTPGVCLDLDLIKAELARRAPYGTISTSRHEKDSFEIVSGLFNGKTTGTPLTFIIRNENKISKDYEEIYNKPRPGHADYTGYVKYKGANDYRGGGHFSGRITALIAIAGAVAKQLLKNIKFSSRIVSIGDVVDDSFFLVDSFETTKFGMISEEKSQEAICKIEEAKENNTSLGGIVTGYALGVEAGHGDPFFDSLESQISHLLFSIPAVKGVSFGAGFDITKMSGHRANDLLYFDDKKVKTLTNYNGGINGGISNGMPIIVNVAFKPTPSIARNQETVNLKTGVCDIINVQGRHDPCIVHRARVLVEDCLAIALLDQILCDGE